MAKIVGLPKLSPTMEEGTLARWAKKEGDTVAVDELIAEIETDKATMEWRSFDPGVLLKILAEEGSVLEPDAPVAIFGEAGEDITDLLAELEGGGKKTGAKTKSKESKSGDDESGDDESSDDESSDDESDESESEESESDESESDESESEESESEESESDESESSESKPKPSKSSESKSKSKGSKSTAKSKTSAAKSKTSSAPAKGKGAAASSAPPARTADGRVLASPLVRRLAREHSVDLEALHGTGPHGRIIKRDLDARLAEGPVTTAAAGTRSGPRIEKLSSMRKTIARRLTESKQTVPHFYLTIDVDAAPLLAARARINEELADAGEKVSVNDLILKAVAVALRRVPNANASFAGDSIHYHQVVDISVAVAIPDGLVTPVVRDADVKGVRQIALEVRDLAGRARNKKLTIEEMTNGTFSVSNLGMYGIEEFAAVINPPEGCILAVGAVRTEPVVTNGALAIGQRMKATLSCDHRVVDGAIGAEWLAAFKKVIESPVLMLL